MPARADGISSHCHKASRGKMPLNLRELLIGKICGC
jgi:hypothetical protein